jgi:hypothetical protein
VFAEKKNLKKKECEKSIKKKKKKKRKKKQRGLWCTDSSIYTSFERLRHFVTVP